MLVIIPTVAPETREKPVRRVTATAARVFECILAFVGVVGRWKIRELR